MGMILPTDLIFPDSFAVIASGNGSAAQDPAPMFQEGPIEVGAGAVALAIEASLLGAEGSYAVHQIAPGNKFSRPTAEAAAKASGPLGVLFRPIIDRFVRFWGRIFRDYTTDGLRWFTRWLGNVNTELENWTQQQLELVDGIGDAFDYLVNTRLYGGKSGDIPALKTRVANLNDSLYNKGGGQPLGWIWRLGNSVDTLAENLVTPKTGRVPKLEVGLATLSDSLLGHPNGWIWRLGNSLDTFADHIVNPKTGVLTLLGNEVNALEADLFNPKRGRITGLETRVNTLDARSKETTDYLAPMRQLVPPAAVAAFIATEVAIQRETGLGNAECRTRQRDICQADPLSWLGLVSGLLLGPALELFPVMAELTGGFIGEIQDEAHTYAAKSLAAFD